MNFSGALYQNKINQIDRHVFNGQYEIAAELSDKIFLENTDVFYHDILNNLKLNSYLDRKKSFKKTLTYIYNSIPISAEDLSKDLSTDYIDTSYLRLINDLFIEQNCKVVNSNSKDFLRNLYAVDQRGRTEMEPNSRDSLDITSFQNFTEFYNIHGFAGEKEIGAYIDGVPIWSIYSTLFRHFAQVGYGEEAIKILEIEFEEGNVPATILANAYDLEYNLSRGKKKDLLYQNGYIVLIGESYYRPLIDFETKALKNLNERRSKIGLEKLDLSIKQAICGQFCNEGLLAVYDFEPYSIIDNYPMFMFEKKEDKELLRNLRINISKELMECSCNE